MASKQFYLDMAAALSLSTQAKRDGALKGVYLAEANRTPDDVVPDPDPPPPPPPPPPPDPPPIGVTPGTVDRPFASDSPFNTPTPADAKWFDHPQLRTHWWALQGFTPVFAKMSDPTWTFVLPDYRWPDGHRNRGAQTFTGIRAPDGMVVGAGTDKVLMVVQPDGFYIEIWQAVVNAGARTVSTNGPAGWATGNMFTGLGVGDNANNAGVRAANFSWAAGLVTPRDIAQGNIDHALAILLGPQLDDREFKYRWPATCWDNGSGQRGAIMMGSKIGIPAGVAMPAGLTALGQLVFKAFQKYGGYVGDFVGGGVPGIQIDDRVPNARPVWDLYAHWDHNGSADLDKMQPLMRVEGYAP